MTAQARNFDKIDSLVANLARGACVTVSEVTSRANREPRRPRRRLGPEYDVDHSAQAELDRRYVAALQTL
jgi:hypothetical protein